VIPAAEGSRRVDLAVAGAVAAGVGGLIWVAKGGAVLVTGRETLAGLDLGALFVAVQVLFGVALLGLHRRLLDLDPRPVRADLPSWLPGQGREGPRAAIGVRLAILAVVLGVVYLILWIGGQRETALAAVAGLLMSLAWVAAAGLLGVAALRRVALPPPAHALPLTIALGAVGLFVVFGLVSNFYGPGWLEVPVVVVGAAWVVLGAALWTRPPSREQADLT
jgi:hypothetical protein